MEATNAVVTFGDGNMEAVGTGSWTPSQATLSKQTGTPHTGLQLLRVAYNGFADGAAVNGTVIVGHVYHITGWARGDGTSSPLVTSAWMSPTYFAGTSSNSWQSFDVTVVATATYLQFGSHDLSSGHYVEFDDIGVADVTAGSYVAYHAIISKQTTNPHSGNQVIRVAYDGSNNTGLAYQSPGITVGKKYKITGWMRSDGLTTPLFNDAGVNVFCQGTTATTWQYCSATFVAQNGNISFQVLNLAAGRYAEYDDVFVTEVTGYTQVQDRQGIVDGDMEGKPIAIVNGNFEGAAGPPPANWTQLLVTATRVAGTRTGGEGSYVAQLAYNNSDTIGYLYQYISLVIGKTYHVTGWARSVDGVAVPAMRDTSAAGLVWDGTNSTSWQRIDYVAVAQSTGLMMKASSLGVGGAVQFDDLSVIEIGTTAWGTVGANLSKQTASPHSGQYLLRVTADGSGPYGYAIQSGTLTIGKKYHVTGWARSDGVQVPRVYLGGSLLLWYGSTATTWQRIDATGVAAGNTIFYLAQDTNNSGYVEFDDVTVTEDKGKQQVIDKQVVIDGDMEGLPMNLVDAAMEAVGTSAWAAGTATLSKQTTNPHGGNQVLRVTKNGGAYAYAYQTLLTSGHVYHVTGWARNSGHGEIPMMQLGTSVNWTGASSTAWQAIDVTAAANNTTFYLLGSTPSAGNYVEFDDVSIIDVGTSAWSPGSSNATLTKTTTGQHGGKYALRAAWTSGTYVYASGGAIFTPGKTYRMTGWVRSDGTVTPTINMSGGQNVWTGTTATSWQKIDVTFKPLYNSLYLLYYASSPAWVEWDDLFATATN